jgi:hypothetical protein
MPRNHELFSDVTFNVGENVSCIIALIMLICEANIRLENSISYEGSHGSV